MPEDLVFVVTVECVCHKLPCNNHAGMPYPQNLETARQVEDVVRQHGAVPATIAIIAGEACIGLNEQQLEHLASTGTKVRKGLSNSYGLYKEGFYVAMQSEYIIKPGLTLHAKASEIQLGGFPPGKHSKNFQWMLLPTLALGTKAATVSLLSPCKKQDLCSLYELWWI
eukprot:1158231-Pelagomonas_calceolata.AAC.1